MKTKTLPKQTEAQLHSQVCQYIKAQYPNAIFNTDMSGIKLTIGQATKAKKLRSSNNFPDIVIYETNAYFCGLFIELKSEYARVWKKDGSPANDHIKEQCDMSQKLFDRGYESSICVGFEHAKRVIDNYMNLK